MTNDLTTKSEANVPATPDAHRKAVLARIAALREKGNAPQPRSSTSVFAKFDGNTGAFTAGKSATPIPRGQRFAVPLENASWGCVKWEGGKPTQRNMRPLLDGVRPQIPEGEPKAGDLPKPRHRDGWSDTVGINMTGVGGEFDQISVALEHSSKGVSDAWTTITGKGIEMGESEVGAKEGMFNPVVVFTVGDYVHTDYKRDVFFLIPHIVDYTDGPRLLSEVDPEAHSLVCDADPFAEESADAEADVLG